RWGNSLTFDNLTLANFAKTFSPDLDVRSGFENSLILAVSGATIATLLALFVSYVVVKRQGLRGQILEFVSAIPLTMPGPVMAVAMLWAYLSPPLVLYGTLWILLVAYVTHYIPYGVRTITGSFRQISVEFERAAAVCGATQGRGFRDVVLPLVRSGVLA